MMDHNKILAVDYNPGSALECVISRDSRHRLYYRVTPESKDRLIKVLNSAPGTFHQQPYGWIWARTFPGETVEVL